MRRRNGSFGWCARIQVPPLPPFECQSREDCGRECAGVDTDPVRLLVDLPADAVPVDDDETMVGFIDQERLADPSQVRLALMAQLDSRPDAGVNEQIVAETAGV